MNPHNRLKRNRAVRPELSLLEGRMLLNGSMPHHASGVHALEVHAEKSHKKTPPPGPTITVVGEVSNGGYQFLNFNGPNAGNTAGGGTQINGIANNGTAVGFDIDNNGNFDNLTINPLKSNAAAVLNINGLTTAQAFGVNSSGTVVGTTNASGGSAFTFSKGRVNTFIPKGGTSAIAFGINDKGLIVGQDTLADGTTPGFIRVNGKETITLNAPAAAMGANVVNAQSINNNGLVVGFYQSNTDGQVHGFMANEKSSKKGAPITATAITDPTIPTVAGEPGATFVFSQVLSVNDHGIAVGYYGDSTTSQHGFIYNTHTGQYTFLDDPSEAFCNGVEVTQITGITNSGEISGFYSDANGVFHGFVARA